MNITTRSQSALRGRVESDDAPRGLARVGARVSRRRALVGDKLKRSMIQMAVENESTELLEHLLRLGSNVTDKDLRGYTVLHSGALYGRHECLRLVMQYHTFCVGTLNECLTLSVKHKHPSCSAIFLELGAEPWSVDTVLLIESDAGTRHMFSVIEKSADADDDGNPSNPTVEQVRLA
eukprot:CAMPEP_0203769514 /NCGR_PEP_ID=MMETSP0099_2-20121227/2237_1 /ASSEMBLY_ACC=CAM_ASM_000209 /TAXON_ID=96639 /ORGANISM=" , Strain NY0313808BC1" /LENGTH=177 /DNA_ID=CAMNT_0050666427 /DNA_START=34 /DNA_END=564 /DNA_ORIENTATION=+